MVEMTLNELKRELTTTTNEIRLVTSEIASNKLKFFRQKALVRNSNYDATTKRTQQVSLNTEERALHKKNDLHLRKLKDKKKRLERMIRETR